MIKDVLKSLNKFFDFKTTTMCVIGLLAFITALSEGDVVTSLWIFSATVWVAIARANECSREDAEDRCSELFDLMFRKERTYKDSVSEINRSWEAKLKEKEDEASDLREQLARLTEQYEEAQFKNVRQTDKPEKQVPVRRKKKTEYSERDVTRIKAELRAAGITKGEEE